MKAVILAGGLGTRLSEETVTRPKPMLEIGGRPILWHIMQIFAAHGVREFVICLGYKGYVIKEFFLNYRLHLSDVTIDVGRGHVDFHRSTAEDWRVSLIETGETTMTGGRLKRVREYLGDEDFFMTYGDGVADVDLTALAAFHRAHGRLATLTAVTPPGRFGALEIEDGAVRNFREKPAGDGATINGGFFVLSPRVLDRIAGRFHRLGGRTAGGSGRRRATRGLRPFRLLAGDGYVARQEPPRSPLGGRCRALEVLVVSRSA